MSTLLSRLKQDFQPEKDAEIMQAIGCVIFVFGGSILIFLKGDYNFESFFVCGGFVALGILGILRCIELFQKKKRTYLFALGEAIFLLAYGIGAFALTLWEDNSLILIACAAIGLAGSLQLFKVIRLIQARNDANIEPPQGSAAASQPAQQQE